MRNVIVTAWMSLDGVVQSPVYPDEDRSGGFQHGGWHPPFFDDVSMKWVVDNVTGAGGYLLGRRTYDVFADHWPKASEAEQVLARPMGERPKHVASRTLGEPLAWHGATLLGADVPAAVAALKKGDGPYLLAIGSSVLVRTLIAHDLVDELRLMIDPIVLGSGKRLFGDSAVPKAFRLVQSQATRTGALLVTYARKEGAA
jgi:dihydrofolate reductase